MAPRVLRPSEGELTILRVLWDRGPSTVRQVHEVLAGSRDTGYTTTLKLLQIMARKGLVSRDDSSRTHVYVARVSRDRTRGQIVADLIDRVFGGSAGALVLQALAAKQASPDEIRDIQKLITEQRKRRPS